MINAAISQLAFQLNQYFKNNFQVLEDVVVVSNLMELDGSLVPNANNKLVLMLVNIEKDTVPYQSNPIRRGNDQRLLQHSAPLFLNLYVMLAANFGGGNYAEALKTISNAIGYFQQQAVFDRHNTPGLDVRIEKLILDIENLKIPDLNNLWSLLGGKYLPSVFYKVRMVTVDNSGVIGQVPVITQADQGVLAPDGGLM
ncbi:DUF4255 domain-containing protein [Undibacterium flavidum]|uniref:DUF4255 domain-containing protein n=1 Tax=Undibacterium flavidum TaxID=2762297 RepID=A0ABR6YFI3_9BURK|nr:DUF4255 domain-containing protein [Undibacterium flavidum]MBC3875302.1 DUF4255 domain-containing protein [Undibacterium flavidum]